MSVTVNAVVAPSDWPDSPIDVSVDMPRFDERPHAFAILIGACVYRVAGDGAMTIVMLPASLVWYLRTGEPMRRPRGGTP